MKIKQKLNSIALAGSVLAIFLILFSSTVSAGYIDSDVVTTDTAKLEDMKDEVQKLVDRHTLAESTGAKWTTLLDTAETAILKNNEKKAKSSLKQFTSIATPYLQKKSLSQGSKDRIHQLIEDAKDIISSLP